MTRVAHVMAGAVNGGAELFFERLCLALHDAGEDVLAVIRHDNARGERLRRGGLDPAELRFGGVGDLATRPRLRRLLHNFHPQVVMAWMNRAAHFAPRGPWQLVGRLGGYYDLRHYRQCDHLVGNTRGIVRWLRQQGWAEERTHYLPNFVTDFAATPPATDLPPGRPLLLGLGRLHTDKGFDLAIRALSRLPGAGLAIAGEGPELEALQALARREGVAERVHFLGWRHDAGALLRAADLFLCSSRVEPLGNMVIEAWSAGCPVVAAAAAGPAELLADGACGLLAENENAAALAEAAGTLLHDAARRRSLAHAARSRFEREFAPEPVVVRWREFLAALAG